jgi:transposase
MEQHYIGVDLHKAFFQACAVQMSGERVWERRFPRSAEGLAMFRDRCDTTTRVAVEATGPTWSFVDAIQPTGATLCVVDPRKTRLKAGFAAKTDRLDARRLADALRRESIVSVYVPPPAIRELREVCRGRHQLVRMRSRLVQMIRALLLRSGVEDAPVSRLYGVRGAAWLAHVHLAPEAERTMRRLERLLRVVHGEIVEAESVVATHAAADPIARALDTLVGIGPVRALTLRAEIGDIARFRHGGRELASYAGLVTRVDRSADHKSLWSYHARRLALAALCVGRSRGQRHEAFRCDRPVGAATRPTQGCGYCARRARARPVRRNRSGLATERMTSSPRACDRNRRMMRRDLDASTSE